MSGRGIKIAIQITKKIVPHIVEILQKIDEAKRPQSQGGTKITKAERQKIAIEMSLEIVPVMHDIIQDILLEEK